MSTLLRGFHATKVKCKHMDVVSDTQGSVAAFWMSRKKMAAVLQGQYDILMLYFKTHQVKNPQ